MKLFCMRLNSLFAVATLAVLLTCSSGTRALAGSIYVLSGNSSGLGDGSTRFGSIDTATGNYTEISADVGSFVRNLAWRSDLSAFYVTQDTGEDSSLRTLTTGGVLSGQIGSLVGLSIYGMVYESGADTIYAYNYDDDSTGTISPTGGGFTVLNASQPITTRSPVGGRYALHNGTIYMALRAGSVGQFGTMGTLASSAFSQIGGDNDVFRPMALASDGTTLYGVFGDGSDGGQALYSVDPTSGVPTFLHSVTGAGLGTWFYGAGMTVAPIPEPSTYCMALAGLACGGYLVKRRRKRA